MSQGLLKDPVGTFFNWNQKNRNRVDYVRELYMMGPFFDYDVDCSALLDNWGTAGQAISTFFPIFVYLDK